MILYRRINVAPMMDWTDDLLNPLLRQAVNPLEKSLSPLRCLEFRRFEAVAECDRQRTRKQQVSR